MFLEKSNLIFRECLIKPLDDTTGLILATKCDKNGCEILVRYFMHGSKRVEWFFDFDIELKEQRNYKSFFGDYKNV